MLTFVARHDGQCIVFVILSIVDSGIGICRFYFFFFYPGNDDKIMKIERRGGVQLGLFGTILVTFTLLVLVLSFWCSRYLVAGRRRKMMVALLVLFNGGTAWFIMSNDRWVHQTSAGTGLAVSWDIIIFMGQLITCVLVLLAVFIRWGWRRMMRVPVDESRRRLLKRAAVYPAAAAGLSLYGGLYERNHVVERSFTIPMASAESLTGYRIAQISDIHLGLFFRIDALRALLEQAVNGGADLLAVTGDLFDDVSQNPAAARLLEEYVDRFPDGIWFCLGNHEYYRGLPEIQRLLAQTRVHALYNTAAQVPGHNLWLAGVEYSFAKGEGPFRQQRHDYLAQAMSAVPDGAPVVLLAHHPEFIDEAAERHIPLTLTGHTHGSQFGIFGLPLFPVFKYTRGMVQIGSSYGYVHSGNGSWFPFRIGCPPELAYFNIQAEQ